MSSSLDHNSDEPTVLVLGSDSDSRLADVVASAAAFWLLAALLVALRFYVRTSIVRVLGPEDWTILLGLIFSLGNSVGQGLMTTWGYGTHIWTIPQDEFVKQTKTGFAVQVCYTLSLAFTKISILVLYLRILTYRHAQRITWIVLVVTVLYNLAGFLLQVTTCIPLQKLWDSRIYGTCHNASVSWFLVASTIATDFVAFVMPIPIFASMTIPTREKVLLVGLFGLGFLECLISVLRLVVIARLVDSVDFTWDFVPISHWNCAELNVAIVCACLMTMKPLIAKLWPDYLPRTSAVARLSNVTDSAQPESVQISSSSRERIAKRAGA